MSTILVDGNYAVDASQSLTFTATSGVPVYNLDGQYYSVYPNFTDQGAVQINSSQASATVVALGDNGTSTFANSLIEIALGASLVVNATGTGSIAYGYQPSSESAAFENDGVLQVSAVQTAIGAAQMGNAYSTITPIFKNTGQITVSAANATGVASGASASLNNSGTLTVAGTTTATGIALGQPFYCTITNTGTIAVTASSGPSYGIAASGSDSVLTVNNTGTISAQYAIYESSAGSTPPGSPILHLTNSGTINGAIVLDVGPSIWPGIPGSVPGQSDGAQIHNTGGINGAIHLDANGNDLYDGRGGTQTGGIYLGGGTDTIYLGNDGETVYGGPGAAHLTGGTGADTFVGGANNDFVDGGGGDDVLDGGGGTNTVSFASAATYVTVSLAVQGSAQATGVGLVTLTHFQNLTGSASADHLTGDANNNVIDGGGGNDVLDGGGGVNTLSFASATAGVTFSLATQGSAQATGVGSVTASNFLNLIGSAHDDVLTGDANDNVIDGGAGGNDVLDGGGGTNTVSFATATAGVTASLAQQGQAQNTGVNSDTFINFQNLTGSAYADHLTGDANNNVIDGGGGNDVLDGGAGTNTVSFASATTAVTVSLALQGQAQTTGVGSVTLSNFQNLTGSAFNDVLQGDSGSNLLTGGAGADTFVVTPNGAADTITDFSDAQGDKIDLTQFYKFTTLSQVLALATQSNADTLINFGGGVSVTLQNVTLGSLTASDFVFTASITVSTSTTTITTDAALNLSATSGWLVNFTTYTGGTLINNGSLTLTSSSSATGVTTVSEPDQTAVFENDGVLSVTGSSVIGVDYATTHNSGTFTVTGTGANQATQGADGDVINSGSMTIQGAGPTMGVDDWNVSGTFQNLAGGTLSTTSSSTSSSASIAGVILVYGRDFENAGLLTVSAPAGHVTGVNYAAYGAQNTVINTGTITVLGGASTGISIGGSYGVSSVSLTNSGTITAQIAIQYAASLGADIVNTGTLNGAIVLGNGTNILDSHAGTINGVITLGTGLNTVYLGHDGETVHGGSGASHVTGGTGGDTFVGGTGDDFVDGGGGNDVLDGGGGINTVSFASATTGITVSLASQGSVQATGVGSVTLANFQNLTGSAHDDQLTGDANDNVIDGGGGGNDVIDGGGGINTASFASASQGVAVSLALQGSAQNTGVGSDTLSNFQNLTGSALNDTLEGDGNNNVIDGGAGTNTVSYAHAATGVTVSLALQGSAQNTVGAGTDTLSNFQNLNGSAFNDTLEGDGNNNVIDGGAGTNTVSYAHAATGVTVSLALQGSAQNTVGAGTDTLSNFQNLTGSAFNDTLEGDANNNTLDGGTGTNTVSYAHAASGVTVSLALQGSAQNTVGAGTDTLSNFQNLTGSAFNDTLEGDANNNVLNGGAGTNTVSYAHAASGVTVSLALQGQAQNTVGAGTDTLSNFQNLTGSAFNDTLTAGSGVSTLTGGGGGDTFVIPTAAGAVTITDFSDAQGDKIDLTAFVGLNSLAALQNHAVQSGSDTIITIGSTSIDLQNVQLSSLTASDFLLSSLIAPISVTGALTINAGQNLTFSGSYGGYGAYAISGTGNLKVYGTVLVQDPVAGDVLGGAITTGSAGTPIFWIQPGGSVTVSALGSGATADGFYAAHAYAGFENDGTFTVSSIGSANGVTLNAGGLFLNAGVMTVTGQSAFTVSVSETGAIVAGNTGSFSVTGPSRVDGFDLTGSGSFNNTGTVTVTSSGSGPTYGVLAGDSAGSLFSVINSGTITAQYAVNALVNSGPLSVANKGTLNGEVLLGSAAGNSVGNIGVIHGAVIFDGTSGDQIYDGRGGTLSGGVTFASGSGVTGTDYAHLGNDGETVHGGSALLYAYGGTGSDHITGGAGFAYIDGGGGNDMLDGGGSGLGTVAFFTATTGVTVSLALQGQAQNTGDGIDTLTHFTGLIGSKFDDHLTGDAGDNLIDGGGGNDVLDGGGGFNTVAFTSATTGVTVSLELQERAQNTGVGTDILTNFQGVIGSSYNDVLEGGGSASTTLTGGAGADTFVYQYDRDVTITDFSAAQGDKIDFSSLLPRYMSLSDVLAAATQVNSNTIITLGSGISAGHLTLIGVSLASLTAADFIFYTGPTVGPISGGGGSPTTGNGTMNGTSGSDWLQGGTGNDILHGGAGGDYLDGRAGVNTASYDGAYHQYTINLTSGPGLASVFGGPEGGTDDLANIQRIQFVDGYLATSPTDTAGQVYRIYEATLGRAPDQEGLSNWVNSLNSGSSLQSVVGGFVNSTEFQQVYGALDNTGFVTLLYHNVLHRDPDSGGLANWVGMLASGQDTRAQVVLGFSESNEDIAALAAPVQQGLWIADAAAGEVARLYDTVLGRLPDGSGLANWTHSLEAGSSLQSVANGFVGSQEFQSVYGALNNTDFVTLLYHNVLHRDPDTGGLNNWVGMLASGQETRAQVVVGFSESAEHITNTAAHVDGGIWLVG